jgi:hypothetical protein
LEKTVIEMTQERIDAGTPGSHLGCATALAVREHHLNEGGEREPLPHGRVRVEQRETKILNDRSETVRKLTHTDAAFRWIRETDDGAADPAQLVIDWENNRMDVRTDT